MKAKRISFSESSDKISEQQAQKDNENGFRSPTFKEDALIIYYNPLHFYSQKVIFILYEKHIDFIPYAVDLTNGEQYSNWFLKLNPKGEVPVLQKGSFILPDSAEIINYLERKYVGSDFVSLSLPGQSGYAYAKFKYYDQLLGKMPVGALTLGSLIHEDLKLSPKPPFVGSLRQELLAKNEKAYEMLKNLVEDGSNTNNKTALLKKLDLQERRKRLVYSQMEFKKLLDMVQNVLKQVETELQNQQAAGKEWLICADYTQADVSLGLLLHRLYQLGYENYFWTYGKMPHVESYFLRFKKRLAYHKLMPSHFEMLKDFWQSTPSNLKLGAGFLGMALVAAFAQK